MRDYVSHDSYLINHLENNKMIFFSSNPVEYITYNAVLR